MKKSTKIIVVGAGPVGCYLGQLLKNSGYSPLLLEDHAEVGRPVQCAGIVGSGIFKEMRLPVSTKSIINTINGADIHFNGSSFSISRNKVAHIIERETFDKEMSKDLNIEFNTALQDVHPIKDGYILKTNNGEYYADVVVGADGPNSRVRKSLEFYSDMKLYRGYQYRVKMTPKNTNKVEVHYVKPFSMFTWIIPEGNGISRIGTISPNPYQELNGFMEKIGGGEIIEKNAGLIPIGTCQLVKGRAALLGDAACQVKPITSGGIYYGMKSAEILVDAIKEGDLALYENRWSEKFEREVKICLLARNVLENMNEDVLRKIFSYAKENIKLIEKTGDFENHSSVIWGLAANPRTYPTIGTLVMGLLKNPKFLFRSLLKEPR
ncbi:MAG: NAD(P)/FAD-dependent oxidoreductase [Candidatus Margulisiibacteriota bacterium]|nr:NAD(P)/FAD-dependent oxidoreductase [Candidatus Margulisiibacteriota bacterium]